MKNVGIVVAASLLAACTADLDPGALRVSPEMIELTTDIGVEQTVPIRVFVGDTEVTAGATFDVHGAQIGAPRANAFAASGLAAGRASLVVEYAGESIKVPVHVRIASTRLLGGAAASAVATLDAATAAPYDAKLQPAAGAIIPPNLGTIEARFTGEESDDVFEVRAQTEDLDLRVVGPKGQLLLSALEWSVVKASVPAASELALTSRSLSTTSPGIARTATSRVKLGTQPVATKLLFGAALADAPALYHYDMAAASAVPVMSTTPQTSYLGGDIAVSKTGARVAVASPSDQGNIVDVPTRSYLVSEEAPQSWTTAAYDPSGYLVTAQLGDLNLRDGEDASVIANLKTLTRAESPAISPDGTKLAYVTVDGDTQFELYVAPWSAATQTLGEGVLAFTTTLSITEPTYSSDGAWLLFGGSVVKTAGGATPTQLVPDTTARAGWASAVTTDGAWIALSMHDAQLYLAHFDATTGTLSVPFLLPGQPDGLTATRAPHYVAEQLR